MQLDRWFNAWLISTVDRHGISHSMHVSDSGCGYSDKWFRFLILWLHIEFNGRSLWNPRVGTHRPIDTAASKKYLMSRFGEVTNVFSKCLSNLEGDHFRKQYFCWPFLPLRSYSGRFHDGNTFNLRPHYGVAYVLGFHWNKERECDLCRNEQQQNWQLSVLQQKGTAAMCSMQSIWHFNCSALKHTRSVGLWLCDTEWVTYVVVSWHFDEQLSSQHEEENRSTNL